MTAFLIATLLAFAGAVPTNNANPEPTMSRRIQGPFDVKLHPQAVDDPGDAEVVGRMGFDKRFHGDLDAIGRGVMLYSHSPVEGSGAYVAIERVTGSLDGRQGSFVFQHNCHMDASGQHQSITVVPDSGTGELVGLRGTLTIRIDNGAHFYDFDYSLPPL
jgi:hypothetical protein